MKELTPQEIRALAEEVTGHRSKSGKTLYPEYINSTDELVAKYREYCIESMRARHSDTPNANTEKYSEMYAELATSTFKNDLPALIVLFSQYLRQH